MNWQSHIIVSVSNAIGMNYTCSYNVITTDMRFYIQTTEVNMYYEG